MGGHSKSWLAKTNVRAPPGTKEDDGSGSLGRPLKLKPLFKVRSLLRDLNEVSIRQRPGPVTSTLPCDEEGLILSPMLKHADDFLDDRPINHQNKDAHYSSCGGSSFGLALDTDRHCQTNYNHLHMRLVLKQTNKSVCKVYMKIIHTWWLRAAIILKSTTRSEAHGWSLASKGFSNKRGADTDTCFTVCIRFRVKLVSVRQPGLGINVKTFGWNLQLTHNEDMQLPHWIKVYLSSIWSPTNWARWHGLFCRACLESYHRIMLVTSWTWRPGIVNFFYTSFLSNTHMRCTFAGWQGLLANAGYIRVIFRSRNLREHTLLQIIRRTADLLSHTMAGYPSIEKLILQLLKTAYLITLAAPSCHSLLPLLIRPRYQQVVESADPLIFFFFFFFFLN